ncbi:MAG TPA: c-type cytochrome [Gammaproteobacteria bacterium]|nr:c-type cytochrome [Gammaproteobacteria bacterium]
MRPVRACATILLALTTLPAFAASPAPAQATANAAKGRVMATTCTFCHGIKDYTVPYPTMHVPLVGGQHAAYIVAALKEYAKGDRDFPTMHAQAASLTGQQIRDIAAWFASVGPVPAPSNGNAKAPSFATTCASCHGARGVSTSPKYPSLAGQKSDYLLRALQEYKSGKRKNAIMNGMASGLTLAQMKKLANYFSRQTPAVKLLPLDK